MARLNRWMRVTLASVISAVALLASPAAAQGPGGGPVLTDYYLLDAVGSVRVVTDDQGIERTRHDYLPFGAQTTGQCGAAGTPQLYAGKLRDPETCLDNLGARYYQSSAGRLWAVDPALDVDAAVEDPQRWNRYSYALNNPYRFVDPDGRNPAAALALLAITAQRLAMSPAGLRAQQAAVQNGTAIWNSLTRLFNSPAGQEIVQIGAEILTGGNAGPTASAGLGSASQGFGSYSSLKRAVGSAGPGLEWHHIVEQTRTNVSRFGANAIQNVGNLVPLPTNVHRQVSAYYSTKPRALNGLTVREWLRTKSLDEQRRFGIEVLERLVPTP